MCVGVCHICIYIHVFSCLSRIVCQMSYFITICIYAIYIYMICFCHLMRFLTAKPQIRTFQRVFSLWIQGLAWTVCGLNIDWLIDWRIDRFVSRMNAVHRVLTYASNISYYNISMCTGSIAEDLEIPSTIAKAIMNILHALNNQFQAEAASNK